MANQKAIDANKPTEETSKDVPPKTDSWFHNLLKGGFDIGKQSIAILVLVIVVITPLVYMLTVPIPTQIQADLLVDRVSFRVATPVELKQPIRFNSAAFTEFEHVRFTPSALPLQKEQFTSSVLPLQSTAILSTVNITGLGEQLWPTVTIDTKTPSAKHFGTLHELTIAKGADVLLSIESGKGERRELSITINNDYKLSTSAAPFVSLRHSGAFHITTQSCRIDGMKLPSSFSVDSLWARKPSINIKGQSDTLKLILSLVDDQDVNISMASKLAPTELQLAERGYIVPKGIAITKLDLLREDMVMGQKVVEPAVEEGKISYPAYPNIEPVSFGTSNFMFFDQLADFKIGQIVFEPSKNSFRIRLFGLAKESVRTYPQNFPENIREYRLTYFDTIAEASKFRQVMFEILLWAIPIIIGVVSIVTITIKLSDDDMTKLASKVLELTKNK